MGKLGLKLVFLENHFISYSCIISIFFFNALRRGCIKFCWFSKIHFFYNFDQSSLIFDQSKLRFKNFSESLPGSIDRTCFSINRTSWIKFFLNTVFDSFKTLFQNFFKLSSLSLTWQGSTEDFLSFSTKFFVRFFSPKAGKIFIHLLLLLFSWFHA